MSNNDTAEPKRMLNLKEAATYVGLSAGVIRKATDEFTMTSKLHEYNEKEPVSGLRFSRSTETNHMLFDPADLDAWKNREKKVGGGQRGDGKKYVVRLTPEELATFKELFPNKETGDPYAYNRGYQAKRKAQKAAANVEAE